MFENILGYLSLNHVYFWLVGWLGEFLWHKIYHRMYCVKQKKITTKSGENTEKDDIYERSGWDFPSRLSVMYGGKVHLQRDTKVFFDTLRRIGGNFF